ncbi:MAG TPA: hypothetical protein VMN81_06445, partial [Vicinamibacterales bacterium]|nr:hypothetical protein [Vicinamibacterales bacterium]
MHLAAGTRLGAYEITGPIGAGGMGEVYRADDARLRRTVAIKILPPHLATPDRLERDPIFRALGSHARFVSVLDRMRRDVEAQRERARTRGLLELQSLI